MAEKEDQMCKTEQMAVCHGCGDCEEGSGLKQLGSEKTDYHYNEPNANILETFDNKYPHRNYKTQFIFPEFTSLCPKTGQPDFATIKITYIADKKCIETKSLKLYLFAYRQFGSFMESITNKLLEDFVNVCQPRWMQVVGNFNARGGISINVEAEYPNAETVPRSI